MKKFVSIVLLFALLFLLGGCSGSKQARECAHCGMRVTPIYRIVNGGEDFYLCASCTVCGLDYVAFFYKIKGSCYYCKNEAQCELVAVYDRNGDLDYYKLVCSDCDAKKE